MMREALRAFLAGKKDVAVVAEAGDGDEALEGASAADPDIVIMGINTPGMGGIEATKRLIDHCPDVKVVALSAYHDRRFVLGMLEAGAVGYLIKADEGEELFRALRAVMQGQIYLSPAVSARLIDAVCGKSKDGRPGLAPRERQVLTLLAEGLHSPAIGRRLSIAPATVEVHRRNIMRKVGVRGIAELTKYAIREGMASI
jgi:two-component system NarL family response regulator